MGISKLVYNNTVKFDLTGDTVTADKLLKNVTAHGRDGEPVTGACTFDSDTGDATAAAAEILDGRTAYARGAKLTGTMPNNGAVTGVISTAAGEYAIPHGYHDGSGRVALDAAEAAKLVPGNIREGVEILGVTGGYGGGAQPAQSKSAVPLFEAQTVLPDDGYVLSEVTVAAIPAAETPNSAGGLTLTIGGGPYAGE